MRLARICRIDRGWPGRVLMKSTSEGSSTGPSRKQPHLDDVLPRERRGVGRAGGRSARNDRPPAGGQAVRGSFSTHTRHQSRVGFVVFLQSPVLKGALRCRSRPSVFVVGGVVQEDELVERGRVALQVLERTAVAFSNSFRIDVVPRESPHAVSDPIDV